MASTLLFKAPPPELIIRAPCRNATQPCHMALQQSNYSKQLPGSFCNSPPASRSGLTLRTSLRPYSKESGAGREGKLCSSFAFRSERRTSGARAFFPWSREGSSFQEALPEEGASGNDRSEREGAAQAASLGDFARFYQDEDSGAELQTAVVTYWKRLPFWNILRPDIQVDLVSAVHIADQEYFEDLQEELATYDRVLFEMVADKRRRVTWRSGKQRTLSFFENRAHVERWKPPKPQPGRRGRGSIIGTIQGAMAAMLRLNFQLDCMDYRGNNWYHADLDWTTFQRLQKERGETFLSFARDVATTSAKAFVRGGAPSGGGGGPLLEGAAAAEGAASAAHRPRPWKRALLWAARFVPMPLVGLVVIEGVCAPPGAPLAKQPEVKALLDLDLATALKVVLAKQITMNTVDSAAGIMEKSVIIGERNSAAMRELQLALDEGCHRIAIFYGSGHLPDMHRRLCDDFGMTPVGVEWRTAWKITGQRREAKGVLSRFLRKLAKATGWRLNRYQTTAMLLLSAVLAVDLWLWEVVLNGLEGYIDGVIEFVVPLLDRGWAL